MREGVESVFPVIEVVGTRYTEPKAGGKYWAIADQGAAGAFVQGLHLRMKLAQWDALGLEAPVTMSVGGEEKARGCARDVLDSPVHALAWCINFLTESGVAIPEGAVISTGTMTGLVATASDATVSASFPGTGILSATLTHRAVA